MVSSSYVIAIPTYRRYELLKNTTLALLEKHNINKSIIYIFVASKTEAQKYNKTLKNIDYKIIIGKKGLKNQRNFITKYFSENTNILSMDDDVSSIKQLYTVSLSKKKSRKNYNYRLKEINNLDRFIKLAFKLCKQEGLYLWGVYPLSNSFFMDNTVTKDLRFVVGPFWGVINRHSNDLFITINEKENVERTIKYYIKDKGVLRFNNIAITTKYYKNPGGMQASRNKNSRKQDALKSAQYLVKKYPQYAKLHLTKKSGHPEVKLKRTRKRVIKTSL